ncbi:hypothetical protein ACFQZ4_18360 [Catellatospora coxensis]|uniref:DUF4034 domain-containing protein n=1 Tax=Catellatospora coxensis TaxID=310354 RepID=A0A8J3L2C8_9ACTN|nr:hypothetical protein [Catellatospora coxensis]GIG10543.1 hypothetical protein Cco03nite_72430 [Catellatospora coxensis]
MTIIPAAAAPSFDRAAAFPEVQSVRTWCRQGDWDSLARHFAQLQTPDAVYFTADVVAEVPGVMNLLGQVAEARPSAILPKLLIGARAIDMAWEARTGAQAQHVSREQFAEMHEFLRFGEERLLEVTAREPDNGAAWAMRITNARGLELGQAEARRRYDRLAKHHPHMFFAQTQLLQQLCPKWGGSWEAAFGFARQCTAAAPEGSINAKLITEVHLEYWLASRGAERAAYLHRPEVLQELADAARRSVLHPSFRPVYGWVGAHSGFACLFSLAGEHGRAAAHFRALGGLASTSPWSYLGDAAQEFVKHRDLALKVG